MFHDGCDSFQLIFLNKSKYSSCRDLSPNRPFQELKMKQHGHFLNYQGDGFSFLVILIFSCSSATYPKDDKWHS